jgi:CBS domain-containing protein
MRAIELMSTPVVTVATDATTKQAAKMLVDNDITAVPVVDQNGRVVGILSEADLIRGQIQPDARAHLTNLTERTIPQPRSVADVMTRDVICVPPFADAADIAALMLKEGIESVPVLKHDVPVGMISRRDLLATLVRDDGAIAAEVIARLSDYANGPSPFTVAVADGVVTLIGDTTIDEFGIARLLSGTVSGVKRVHPGPAHRQGPGQPSVRASTIGSAHMEGGQPCSATRSNDD